MFVVKKPVTVNKTIRLPEELLKRMETIASQKDISLNQLIVQCCEYALNDLAEEPQTESRTES
ncbi:toxin-antitoxin system HicB family antitoxin [Acetobacterium sp.]|uniref:toxin-antitoxin system HicB family antitoxin n=1 Tax=Acetobacterium sp. TaxID=1872094 RepID=UPI003593AE16